MFKAVACALLCVVSFNVLALDEASARPESHQKIIKTVVDELGIKSADKSVQEKIYAALEHALKDDWYSYWVGNRDLEKSRFKDDKVRIVDLIIPNNTRVNNITFTYFPEAQQIFYSRKQFVEGGSDVVMDSFKKAKSNTNLKKFYEKDNYAFFQKEGFVDFEIYHVKTPNAAITYIDYGVIDLK